VFELGENKEKFHKNLLGHIENNKIDIVIIYGELMTHLHEESKRMSKIVVKYFQNQSLLIDELNKTISNNDIIYIKGSRGMKMENIIKGLK
jgi:UDP-N-acetylmuramoyl-tripeptide--D-alanyl-D-alanine ligase